MEINFAPNLCKKKRYQSDCVFSHLFVNNERLPQSDIAPGVVARPEGALQGVFLAVETKLLEGRLIFAKEMFFLIK